MFKTRDRLLLTLVVTLVLGGFTLGMMWGAGFDPIGSLVTLMIFSGMFIAILWMIWWAD